MHCQLSDQVLMVIIEKGVVDILRWCVGCESERVMVLSWVCGDQAGTDVTWEEGTKQVLTVIYIVNVISLSLCRLTPLPT